MQGNGARPRLALRDPELWTSGVAGALTVGGVLILIAAALAFPGRAAWGFDLQAYYQAALRLAETGTPYEAITLRGPFSPGPVGLYLYAPLPALLLMPLTFLDQATATDLWFALRIGLLIVTGLLMPVPMRVRLAAFGAGAMAMPVLSDLALGNVSLIVTFLTVLAWRFLDQPLGALAIAGSLFVRPTMGLFLGWWLIRGRVVPLVAALLAAVALALLSMLLIGVRPYLEYLTVLGNIGQVTGVPNNVDLASTVAHLGAPPEIASLALVAGFGLAIGASLLSLRRDQELSFVVVSMAVLFVSPLLWGHYLTQLLVPAAFLAARHRWWGLALPLLAWLPHPALPLVGLAGMLLPFVAADRGERALATALPMRRPTWAKLGGG